VGKWAGEKVGKWAGGKGGRWERGKGGKGERGKGGKGEKGKRGGIKIRNRIRIKTEGVRTMFNWLPVLNMT
jgi:hypothetical protein